MLWIVLFVFPVESCILVDFSNRLVCVNDLPPEDFEVPDLKTLELREIENEELDLRQLIERFPKVENVSIFGGNIRKIMYPKPDNDIKVLQLVQMEIENIGNKFVSNFPNLEVLDLRGNHLQTLNDLKLKKLKELFLANNKWNCSLDLSWVWNLNRTLVKDLDNLTCFGNPHPNKNLTAVANFTKNMKQQCPYFCDCSLPKVVKIFGSSSLEPIIEVNCSHRSLTALPSNLPKGTKIIRLDGNEIEDLKILKQDLVYKHAFDLYLDNNKIKSIEELEGSYFLKHFRILSLSGNKITEIPTYALDNALEQNYHMPNALSLHLGNNPWRCDCVFTPVFQEMLQKFAPQIPDLRDVKCSYVQGDENSLSSIIELSRSSVCRPPTEYSVQALDLVNGILASLILLILGKLAYDYYYFKKTGRLPWIVTKMP